MLDDAAVAGAVGADEVEVAALARAGVSANAATWGALGLVLAPGHPLHLERLAPLPTEPLAIELGQTSGTVELATAGPIDPTRADGGLPMLLHRGVILPPGLLLRWARLHGIEQENPERLVVPHLPPGDYAACRVDLADLVASPEPLGGCVHGYLGPSATLRLELESP